MAREWGMITRQMGRLQKGEKEDWVFILCKKRKISFCLKKINVKKIIYSKNHLFCCLLLWKYTFFTEGYIQGFKAGKNMSASADGGCDRKYNLCVYTQCMCVD